MAAAVKKLEKKERFCRDSLMNLAHLIETYDEDRDKDMLEGWKERLEGSFTDFEEIRLEMELNDEFQHTLQGRLDASALEQSVAEGISVEPETLEHANQEARASFELTYLRIKGFIVSRMRNLNQESSRTNPTGGYQSRVKLPDIKLPVFDGNLKDWPSFRDAFGSLIDSNPQLSNVDKFSYLLSSLSKEAKRVVDVIEVTSANYSVAWELLEKRYQNKYLIVKSYVEALFAVEPIKRECHESLSRLIDEFERNLKLLEKVGECPEYWSTLLVFMLCSRLDTATMRHWETHRKSISVPAYTELVEFLRNHSLVLQSLGSSKSKSSDPPRSPSQHSSTNASKLNSVHSAIATQSSCPFCGKQPYHSPFLCEPFKNMDPMQRFDAVKQNALCINCLLPDHQVKSCSSSACRKCHRKHHTLLHKSPSPPNNQSSESSTLEIQLSSSSTSSQSSTQPDQPASSESQTQATAVSATQTSHFSMPFSEAQLSVPATVLLSTALVKVFSSSGSFLWARALLDSGSQLNLVSENLSQKLNLPHTKEFVPISGVGLSSTSSKHTTNIRIQSHRADFEELWKFHVLPKLTLQLPSQAVDVGWSMEVVLADPTFNQPGCIDLILGAEIFYELLREGQIKQKGIVLQNTALGWVVSGKAQTASFKVAVFNLALVSTTPPMENKITRSWESKTCNIERTLSVEEAERNSSDIAYRRFHSLERRLNTNSDLEDAKSALIYEWWHGLPWLSQLSRVWPSLKVPVDRNFTRGGLEGRPRSHPVHKHPSKEPSSLYSQLESILRTKFLSSTQAQWKFDPNDLEDSTPGHCLVHRSRKAIPALSQKTIPTNRLGRRVRRIWQQRQSEYLSGLQPWTRWTRRYDNVDVGTMVLVREENLPRLKWRIGRGTQIFKGPDDNIRVVMVRTKDGEYRQGISKICVLSNQPKDGNAVEKQEGN